jgi:hypothetical protein
VSQGWLEDMEQAAIKKRNNEPVKDVWAIVFNMPGNFAELWHQNEVLAARNTVADALLHVNTEATEDLEARTVHVSDIPHDCVIQAEDAEPTLSRELMTRLTAFGDIDTVTVRVRHSMHSDGADTGLSWAFVTYETGLDARAVCAAEVTVPGVDHTSSGHHIIPERSLRITSASLTDLDKNSAAARQAYKHTKEESLYR